MAGANPIVLTDCMSRVLFYGCPMAGTDCCGGAKPTPISTPVATTGGVGSPPAPAVIPGGSVAPRSSCSSCNRTAEAPATAAANTGGVAAPIKAARGCPWWCAVLVVMILAGVVQRDNA